MSLNEFSSILNKIENEQITAQEIINKWDLKDLRTVTSEHGYFKEIEKIIDQEGIITETKIVYLLKGKQVSCLHALGTTETWTWLGGKEISLYIAGKKELEEIILNKNNPTFTVEKDTYFGAKITKLTNEEEFAIVTCLCKPGFTPALYKNPTSEDLDRFSLYPSNQDIIKALTPSISNVNKSFFRSSISYFFSCFCNCIGVKNEEQRPLLNNHSRDR